MFLRIIIPSILAVFLALNVRSQFSDNSDIIEKFSFETVQIEEFIERFNFNNDTKLLKYLKNNYPEFDINRKDFLFTLFNNTDTTNNKSLIKSFINNVCDSINPKFLNFYANNWFADANCIFKYDNKSDTGNIILKLQVYPDSSVKWVIESINTNILTFPWKRDSLHFISPVSHGANFISLTNTFKDGKGVLNYLPNNFKPDRMTFIATLMYLNKIKVDKVYNVKYHFLQIPGWTFTVDYYNRKELQSGWLISNLFKMTTHEKYKYKKDLLNIDNPQL